MVHNIKHYVIYTISALCLCSCITYEDLGYEIVATCRNGFIFNMEDKLIAQCRCSSLNGKCNGGFIFNNKNEVIAQCRGGFIFNKNNKVIALCSNGFIYKSKGAKKELFSEPPSKKKKPSTNSATNGFNEMIIY